MPAPLHRIFGRPLDEPVPQGFETIVLGMGCYWGPERLFWQLPGVHMTSVGFAGGTVPNPTYRQVCAGDTGHAEVVRIVFDPSRISLDQLLKTFWENHDPTQGNRQGNDVGSQYRSLIQCANGYQQGVAEASRTDYSNRLAVGGYPDVTTQIEPAGPFWLAEDEHQQYLDRHPDGYCPIHGTGVQASVPEGHDVG